MKMFHECCATCVLWVIWHAEFDGGTYFGFDLRKGQGQAKSGESSNLNIFMPFLSSFLSRLQNVIYSALVNKKCQKLRLKHYVFTIACSLPLQCLHHCLFFTIAQPKIKTVLSNFVQLLGACR